MQLFSIIEDAEAIVRLKNGVFKQVKLYHRAEKVYIGICGGYVRMDQAWGDGWPTSNPNVRVIDMPAGVKSLNLKGGVSYGRPA